MSFALASCTQAFRVQARHSQWDVRASRHHAGELCPGDVDAVFVRGLSQGREKDQENHPFK